MSLKPYRGKHEPLRFGVYDLEWTPETLKPRLCGVRDERGYRSYPDVLSFLRGELTSQNRGKILWAHAGGLADIQFVLDEFIKRDNKSYRVQGHWSGSSLIICKISQGKNCWTFADSFWLFRDSLAKIGTSIGLAKGGNDYRCEDYPACGHDDGEGKCTCVFYAPDGILRDYNERDCEILYRALERFQDEILGLGGKMRLTIASTAMQLFRSAFLRETIPTSRTLNRIAREAYIASRVEVYGRECGEAHYYDVNSSFPHSMTFGLPAHYLGPADRYHEGDCALIDATVTQPEDYLPAIPVRLDDSRIYFPTGTFRRLMTSEDFCHVLDTGGTIERIHEVHRFEPFTDLAEYVDVVYTLRKQETDDFKRLVYKYLLNALYGKFGEDEFKAELVINPRKRPECQGLEGCTPDKCHCVDCYAPGIYRVAKQAVISHAHVPIAAAITSRSRRLLTDYLRDAKRGGRIYYSDTDSVVTTGKLKTGDRLGQLKDEGAGDTMRAGLFLSPKLYKIRWAKRGAVVRSKGFRRLSEGEFDALAEGCPVAIRRLVRIQENFASGRFSPREEDFVKHALSHLDPEVARRLGLDVSRLVKPKRCVLADGDSRPWGISELQESANPVQG